MIRKIQFFIILYQAFQYILHNIRMLRSNWPSSIPHYPLHPVSPDLFMLLTEVCLNLSIYFSIIHTISWSFPLMNSQLIFTPPCLTLALASNIYTLLTSSHSPRFHFFFNHTPISRMSQLTTYHVCHNSPHTHPIFFPYMIFECRHHIRNQSMPQQYNLEIHSATSPR